jgi:hypothetical protein
MSKTVAKTVILNLLVTFGFVIPSFSANLKLEITRYRFKNGGLNHLKIDYQIGSATNVILKPFSYGLVPETGWMGEMFAFEPSNTIHFCVDETGTISPHDLSYWRCNIAKDQELYPQPDLNTKFINLVPIHHGLPDEKFDQQPRIFQPNIKYFRFCLVNEKNEGYVVSNLFSFKLNSAYEICDAENITWSEMPEAAQKSLETLIITKARELKETFTPEMIINRINHWQK